MAAKQAVMDAAEKVADKVDVDATLNSIEKTLDVIEEQVETIERIPKLRLNGTTRKQQIIILATTAVVAAATGGGISWFLTKKAVETKYEKILKKEIEEVKDHYRVLRKDGVTPASLVEERVLPEVAEEIISENKYSVTFVQDNEGKAVVVDEPETVTKNIFSETTSTRDPFDPDEEDRSGDVPYVITEDEFNANEPEYDQTTATYFEGDDVLLGDGDQVITDTETSVGNANLLRFGVGCRDRNTVHVRNEALELDFEITRSSGKYTEEVLGLRHSDDDGRRRRVRRIADE